MTESRNATTNGTHGGAAVIPADEETKIARWEELRWPGLDANYPTPSPILAMAPR
jgi:hypothetical protein